MPSKNPMYLDRVVLAAGGVIETPDGTDIITVNAAGTGATITGTEVITPGEFTLASGKIVYGVANVGAERTLGATFAGTPATVSPTASSSAPAFTGTDPVAAVNFASPVFSGTGQSSAGQVITTTDNQTMTLNQCAGMWFISAEHGPYLIASNTAVTGAPAVLTIYGTAPTTDAGTYRIFNGATPVGTVSAPTITVTGAAYTPAGAITPTYS